MPKDRVVPEAVRWEQLQEMYHNAVVQVVAQIVEYNWLEPYKPLNSYEQRATGFFIDDAGYLITNAHVVNQAVALWIYSATLGKVAIPVELVSFCPERDLALLRVPESEVQRLSSHTKMTPLPCGDSDTLEPTEPVLVLGFPLGVYALKSVTGVVSGRESYNGRSLIQMTAPVNHGNSGGPLINNQGQVIGIAVATVVNAQNMGFTIPINDFKRIERDLRTQPFVRMGSFGARFNYATDELAQLLGNPAPTGLYINTVFSGSLFAKHDIRAGDMLYACNGCAVDAFGDVRVPWSSDKMSLIDMVARLHTGDELSLLIYRQGKPIEVTCTFEVMTPAPIRW